MISGFIDFLTGLLIGTSSASGMSTLMFIILVCTGLGIIFILFRFIKSFNIFN